MKKNKEIDINLKKLDVNSQHIIFYDELLKILTFTLEEFSRELTRSDIEFLEMPKNVIATFDFLISSIGKIQKGQRLALGLEENNTEDTSPVINIIEGLSEEKI